MSDLMNFSDKDPVLKCDDETCTFETSDVKEAMEHAANTLHSITGPGKLEGTTLTVSVTFDDVPVEPIPVWPTIMSNMDRFRLDKVVLHRLMRNPTEAKTLSDAINLVWEHHAPELRGSLLRLQEAGLVDVVYGLGWMLTKKGSDHVQKA